MALSRLVTRSAVAAIAVSLATSAFAQAKKETPILIGAAIAESGFMNAFDGPSLAGFKVFMEQVNAKGGIGGRKLALKVVDTKTTAAGGKEAATQLLSAGAEILLTSANFDFGAPAGNVAQAANVLNFSLGAASALYGPVGIGPEAFTPAPSTTLEGKAMAQVLVQLKLKKPFVLTDDTIDYATQIGDGVKAHFAKLGVTLAGEATFKNSDTSIATQISKIQSSGADCIALATYLPGGATALRQIRAAGITLPIVSDLGMGGADWASAVPGLSNFYVTAIASIYGDDPNPAVQTFVADYKASTGALPPTTQVIEGYNVGELIAAALTATGGKTDGPALSKALSGLSNHAVLGGSISYSEAQHIREDGPVSILAFQGSKPAWYGVVTIGKE